MITCAHTPSSPRTKAHRAVKLPRVTLPPHQREPLRGHLQFPRVSLYFYHISKYLYKYIVWGLRILMACWTYSSAVIFGLTLCFCAVHSHWYRQFCFIHFKCHSTVWYITVYLFVILLMDVWGVSLFFLLWIINLAAVNILTHDPLRISPGAHASEENCLVWIQRALANLLSVVKLFSKVVMPVCPLTGRTREFPRLHILTDISYFQT